MIENIFVNSTTANAAITSAQEASLLFLRTSEQLANFYLDRARSYSEFGYARLRTMLQIKDAKALQDFISGQSELAEEIGKQWQQDAKTLSTLMNSYSENAQKLVEDQFSHATRGLAQEVA